MLNEVELKENQGKQLLSQPTPMIYNNAITRPTHRRTDANMYPLERQLTKASEPSFDLEGGAKGQI